VSPSLDDAFALHQAGRLAEAEAIYRTVLGENPGQSQAAYLLAIALLQQGRAGEAAERFEAILAERPDHADAAYHLGLARQIEGRLEDAAAAYRWADNLGGGSVGLFLNLGAALHGLKRLAEARHAYERALALEPDHAGALCNLGALWREEGRPDEALAALDRALKGDPDSREARQNRALVRRELGDGDGAIADYRALLAKAPERIEAWINLGVLLKERARWGEARQAFETALARQPGAVEAAANLGALDLIEGRFAEARRAYDRALAIDPGHVGARFNRGFLNLLEGDYPQGFADWEARLDLPDMAPFRLQGPVWDGAPLRGTLLLQAEQGYGDTLNFIRYATLAAKRAGRLVLRVQPALAALFDANFGGFAQIVAQDRPPPAYDAWALMMSLPARFHTTIESIPSDVPYLAADPAKVSVWRQRLGSGGPKVGLVWRGSPGFKGEESRAPGLAPLGPLFDVPGMRFVSLQRGPGRAEIAALGLAERLVDCGDSADPMVGEGFESTAALVQTLDLVITTDTAMAHLAGALAKPVWVLLSTHPDWRWGPKGETTPWYPTARLFRQRERGRWDTVGQAVAQALGQWAGG